MKSELRENMYVRTKDGYISQYKYYDTTNAYMEKLLCIPLSNGTFANIEDIVKTSYNIIDLIKSKDIILGRDGKIYQCWKIYKDYVFTYSKNKQGQTITLVDYQIDKVLTHEQFEHESYKVGE
nr:MAG TPA: hypothetical protein [Crassvirales sp.]